MQSTKISALHATNLSWSVSSSLMKKIPPFFLASSHAYIAVRRCQIWGAHVGLGAKRVLGGIFEIQ